MSATEISMAGETFCVGWPTSEKAVPCSICTDRMGFQASAIHRAVRRVASRHRSGTPRLRQVYRDSAHR